jgi:transposase
MLQITPQMKILVAVEPADFRRGIDGLARLCQETLEADPFVGTVFVFRNRRGTALDVESDAVGALLVAWTYERPIGTGKTG